MKTAVCTPVHGSPRADYTRCLARMLLHTASERPDLEVQYWLAEGHLIANRNDLAAGALAWGADHVLWIDADMRFPPETLLDLLACDVPLVAANCPTRSQPPGPTAHIGGKALYTRPGCTTVEQVDGVGLGLVLMRSDVLRQLGVPAFAMLPNARYPGEDKDMCQRLAAAGVPMFVHHGLSQKVGHIVEHVYTHDIVNAFADR